MLSVYLYSISSVVIVSLVSLIGVSVLSVRENILRKYLFLLVSLAVGALLGDAFIHLIPESFETIGNATHVSLAIIAGIVIFFVIEKFIHWHHHAEEETTPDTIHPTGRMALISDGLHNFIDGLIIGASYLVSIEVGIATTIAVMIHEIPQEIGDFGILLHSGYTKLKALWLNFLSGLMAVGGVLVALVLSTAGEKLALWLIPIAAGGFIYIALSDLIPELHKTKDSKHSLAQLGAVLIGILAMFLLLAVE